MFSYCDILFFYLTIQLLAARLFNKPRSFVLVRSDVLGAAKNLRHTDDPGIATNVYVNSDLSPPEARLAFQKRQQRRAARNKPAISDTQGKSLLKQQSMIRQQ